MEIPSNGAGRAPTPAPPTFRKLVSVFGKIGLLSFGGPAGADRTDASRAGRRAALARRATFSLRTQLLHVAARPGGDAARDLFGLAPARRQRWARRRPVVRAARRDARAGAVDAVRRLRPYANRRGAIRRHQGGRARHRAAGAGAGRKPRHQGPPRLERRRRRLRGDLLLQCSVPARHRRRWAGRLFPAHRGRCANCSPRPPRPCPSRRRCARWRCGSPYGSCRWQRSPRSSAASTCWRSSPSSSPSSPS